MITLLTQALQLVLTVAIPIVISVAGHGAGFATRIAPAFDLAGALVHQVADAAAMSASHGRAVLVQAPAPAKPPAAPQAPAPPPAPAKGARPAPAPDKAPAAPPPGAGQEAAPAQGGTAPPVPSAGIPGEHREEKQPSGEEASGDVDEVGEDEEPGVELRRATSPEVSFGGTEIVVPAGEYHRGDLVNFGGHVTVNGQVRGSVIVIGGVLEITGSVRGDVVAIGSRANLRDGTKVGGEVVNVGGSLRRGERVTIDGQFTSVDFFDLGGFASGRGAFAYFLYMFFWAALIVTAVRFLGVLVVAAIAPHRIEGALAEPRPSWILAFLLGFVVRGLAGILIFILILPCVTIPVAVALWIISRILIWMGIASISLHIGRRVGRTVFSTDLSYFGAILTGFLIYAIVSFIPVFGFFVSAIISSTGLGLMLLTRFGGRKPAKPVIPIVPPGGGPAGLSGSS